MGGVGGLDGYGNVKSQDIIGYQNYCHKKLLREDPTNLGAVMHSQRSSVSISLL